ncbi:MAG: hypothetical protein CMI31_05515 [Opitutae bacterium]|nr:hypothetical protein [Opitutae bacterium]
MKKITSKFLLALMPFVLCSGCNFLQVDEPSAGFINPKRISVVEKAWMSRHEYDPKTGLLQPYYRGMRYGAIRSFDQKEKVVSSKEWWLKDRKLGDLADQPLSRPKPSHLQPAATAVAGGGTTPATPAGDAAGGQDSSGFVASPAAGAQPAGGSDGETFEVFGSGSGAGMPVFATGKETPALPVPPAGAGDAGGLPAIDSPFLPSAPAIPPSQPVPGAALPGAPLPAGGGGFGVDPAPGGNAFPAAPGGNQPFPAPAPDPGGAFPAAPAPGGDNPFGAPPPPGGADPIPAPAPPAGGDNPFGAPPPGGADPIPASPAPGGGADPFGAPPAPAPGGGADPFPAPPAPAPGGVADPFGAPPAPAVE